MKRLHFDYYMQIDYSKVVTDCHFTIKCFPTDTLRQKADALSVEIVPAVSYAKGCDSFGNVQIYGEDTIPHEQFHFRVSGDVRTQASSKELEADENRTAVFRYPHGLNVGGAAIGEYHAELAAYDGADAYQRGVFLMHRLHQDFQYEKGCTSMKTDAEAAWRLGRGVCQDYAHILIALLHLDGIAARYTTGMLVGEGASHAWVEVLWGGCWYGLDPTNDTPVGEDYIRIGCGRDAADCLINRGIMHGGGDQLQTVRVSVKECETDEAERT